MNSRDQKVYIINRNSMRYVPFNELEHNMEVISFSSPFSFETTDYYNFSELILKDYFNGDYYMAHKYAGDFSGILINSIDYGKPLKICGITIKERLDLIDSKREENESKNTG